MRRLAPLALLALVTLPTCRRDDPPSHARGAWTTSLRDALAEARRSGRLVLADFTGSDWCSWCKRLDDEVFQRLEFQDWAARRVVLLEVDFPHEHSLPRELVLQNDDLATRHRVDEYPTILFLDADGREVGRVGYVEGGPMKWIGAAESAIGASPAPR